MSGKDPSLPAWRASGVSITWACCIAPTPGDGVSPTPSQRPGTEGWSASPRRPGRPGSWPRCGKSASEGAQALVVLAFETEAERIVRQAIDSGLYDRFLFGGAAKRPHLVRSIGGAHLGGTYGTGPAASGSAASGAAWEAAYVSRYGALPEATYVREAYDAAVALALAAQAAGSVDGAAIRDRLRQIGAGPGVAVIAGPDGVAKALRVLHRGGAVDYEGAASDLEWDENGDLRRGRVGIWRFTADGRIEDVDSVAYPR